MNAGIEIHALGPPHRDLLITMYDRFDRSARRLVCRLAARKHGVSGSGLRWTTK